MEIEVIEPKKELLRIPVNLDGAPPEVVEVVQAIKKVAERVLYHWEVFPIVLPPPLAVVTTDGELNCKKEKPLVGRNLFVAPSYEGRNIVSLDAKGDPQPLTEKQLQSIAETGQFEVESVNFPGQFYIYRLSQLLQKGKHKTRATFLRDIALALQIIIITARNRLVSQFFSLSQSVRAFYYGLVLLVDAFVGIPALSTENLDARIKEERSKYLVAELTVRPNLEDDLDNLCQFIKHEIKRTKMEKCRMIKEIPPVPYLYHTPKGLNIDLRHMCQEIIQKACPVIERILEKEPRRWFLPFKEKVITELKTKKLTDEDIEKQAKIHILDEYMKRVFNSILVHPKIQELGPGIGALFIEHAQAVILMHRAVDNMRRRLSQTLAQLKDCLKEAYPVLSLINPWVEDRLKVAEADFIIDHQWDVHEESLALCRQHGLEQTSYFLQRDLTFMREREPVLKQELSRVKIPDRNFCWQARIWCPQHWKVTKQFQGCSETVPTVISHTSSSLSQFWSDPNHPIYFVTKDTTYSTTTRLLFWRWINYFYRTYSLLWNAMFFFGVVIPWCSPVSVRALFSIRPFKPDLELNQMDGILYPRKSSATHTLCSRLILLWRHISKSRTEFESRPDTGFIGKGFSRHLNRLWNYLMKGVLGTFLFVVLFPMACLFTSCLSFFIALSAPLWVPCSTLIFHMVMILAYDFDSPKIDLPQNKICILMEALIWHILILGILQPASALIVAFVICPVTSFFILLFASFRYGFRIIWDLVVFQFLIRKRGRVPVSDSWLIKCVAEPFPVNSYYQITPEQALAAFEAKLEIEELNAFREEVERIILLPQQTYSDFVLQCFRPFSAVLSKEGVYKELQREAQGLLSALRDQVERRQSELQLDLSINMRSKIQLPLSSLQLVLKQATEMCQQFYPSHVLKRLQMKSEDFWESRGLSNEDWLRLTAQLFAEIFSMNFFTPLSEQISHQRLEAHGINLSRYTEMLKSAESLKDLDLRQIIHAPKSDVNVPFPQLDISTFEPFCSSYNLNALGKRPDTSKMKGKEKFVEPLSQKLDIPLQIPPPVNIAVLIFNRENEEPIAIESHACHTVLNAIKKDARCPVTVNYDSEDKSLEWLSAATTVDDYRDVSYTAGTEPSVSEDGLSRSSLGGSVLVNLASTEDISLETDGQRVTYSHSSYSTTV